MTTNKQVALRLTLDQLAQLERDYQASGLKTKNDYMVSKLFSEVADSAVGELLAVIASQQQVIASQQQVIASQQQPGTANKQSTTDSAPSDGLIKGMEARLLLETGIVQDSWLYASSTLYLVDSSANGSQKVLKPVAKVADGLAKRAFSHWGNFEVAPRQLLRAVELYDKMVQIDGWQQLSDHCQRDFIAKCLENRIDIAMLTSEIAKTTKQPLAHTHTPPGDISNSDIINAEMPELALVSGDITLGNSDIISDISAVSSPDNIPSTSDITSDIIADELVLTSEEFQARYPALQESYKDYQRAVSASNGQGCWTAPDGLKWKISGKKAKARWAKV